MDCSLPLVDVTSRIDAGESCRRPEDLFRAIVEEQTELICRMRQDGTLTFANGAYERCFGSGGRSLVGKTIWELIPSQDHQAIRIFLSSFTPECPEKAFVHRVVRENGEIRWQHWSNRAFFDRNRLVVEFQAVGRDITDLKWTEETLEEAFQEAKNAQARAEAIIDSLGDAVHIVDRQMTIQQQNKLSMDLFGDRRGRNCHEIFSRGKVEGLGSCLAIKTLRDGRRHQAERVVGTLSGSMHIVEITSSPLRDSSGEVVAAIVLLHDITKAKEHERVLQSAREELERRVAERTCELEQTNEKLRQEAAERRFYHEKLESRSSEFEEANIALNVLLKKSSAAQKEFEDRIVANLRTSILPFLDELELRLGNGPEGEYLKVIKNNLLEIAAPFAQKLDSKLIGLTAREIQTAAFVKQGKTNKEIAELLHVSEGTIKTYRNKIREKIGITNQKVNLRSFLLSLNEMSMGKNVPGKRMKEVLTNCSG